MTTLHMPHPPAALTRVASFVIDAFWAIAIGVVLVFAFFVALGAIDPADVSGVSIAVAAVLVLAGARAWAGAHRARAERDPRLMRARERRGF